MGVASEQTLADAGCPEQTPAVRRCRRLETRLAPLSPLPLGLPVLSLSGPTRGLSSAILALGHLYSAQSLTVTLQPRPALLLTQLTSILRFPERPHPPDPGTCSATSHVICLERPYPVAPGDGIAFPRLSASTAFPLSDESNPISVRRNFSLPTSLPVHPPALISHYNPHPSKTTLGRRLPRAYLRISLRHDLLNRVLRFHAAAIIHANRHVPTVLSLAVHQFPLDLPSLSQPSAPSRIDAAI